jgi:hypothetical protein
VTIRHPVRRRAARDLARALALFSAVLLALSTWSLLSSGSSPVGAAPVAGTLSVDPGEGGSGTEFRLELPGAAACTGDSASGGYQVQTYMIPSSSSPSTLVFGTAGPVEVTGEARRPLMDSNNGDAVVNLQTGITPGGGPGIISGLPFFSFGQLLPGEVPAGTYNIGVACWRPSAEEGEKLDKYWNTKMVVTTDVADEPAGFTWVIDATPDPTTTTVEGGSTTTTADGSTTTTGESTTTTADGTSSTTGPAVVSGISVSGGTPNAASPVTTMGQLPFTGSSPIPMVIWAVALVVFGRMAMLLGKRPKIIGDGNDA